MKKYFVNRNIVFEIFFLCHRITIFGNLFGGMVDYQTWSYCVSKHGNIYRCTSYLLSRIGFFFGMPLLFLSHDRINLVMQSTIVDSLCTRARTPARNQEAYEELKIIGSNFGLVAGFDYHDAESLCLALAKQFTLTTMMGGSRLLRTEMTPFMEPRLTAHVPQYNATRFYYVFLSIVMT